MRVLTKSVLPRVGVPAGALLLAVAGAGPVSAATAPTGIYSGMGTCPLASAAMQDPNNGAVGCVVAVVNGGSFTIGGTVVTIPASSPITAKFGALWPNNGPVVTFPDGSAAEVFSTVAPTDGKELTAAPIDVPIPGLANFFPGVTSAITQVENFHAATLQIAQTTLRSVLGGVDLDSLLSERDRLNESLQHVIDGHTEPWGIKVTTVEIKDVEIPDRMQHAIARQAEAERERRAKIINAEGEFQAAAKLAQAADVIGRNPVTLQLRYLQTLREIGADQNSTVVFPMPIDLASSVIEAVRSGIGQAQVDNGSASEQLAAAPERPELGESSGAPAMPAPAQRSEPAPG